MSDLQAIADRVEIEALRGEYTDAAMMRDPDRLAYLFTPDGALRISNADIELAGRVPRILDFNWLALAVESAADPLT